MGEAINLVENFKVENVVFNCRELNELEQALIKTPDKEKKYYSCINKYVIKYCSDGRIIAREYELV